MDAPGDLLMSAEDWPPDPNLRRSLAFLDLDRWPSDRPLPALPPFPVIGLGNSSHPLAASLDAVVEAPVSAAGLVQSVARTPAAASVAVQLLRIIGTLPVEAALTAESFAYGLLQAGQEHAAWLAARGRPAPLPPGRLRVERERSTLLVTLDRPAARNAIDRQMRDDLFEAFTLAGADPEIDRVELRATGPAFCIGGDLSEFGTTRDPTEAHLIRCLTLPARPFSKVADRAQVHVQGACIGSGVELAAFARHVTAARSAWFQLPELAMGLIPGAGGCVSLSRRIGRQRAALMILSGKRIGSATALDWGLVDTLVDDPSVDDGGADAV